MIAQVMKITLIHCLMLSSGLQWVYILYESKHKLQ